MTNSPLSFGVIFVSPYGQTVSDFIKGDYGLFRRILRKNNLVPAEIWTSREVNVLRQVPVSDRESLRGTY